MSRPFLPGGERGTAEPVRFADALAVAQEQSQQSDSLRPIADFLDTSPVARDYRRQAGGDPYAGEAEEQPDELPPVEHFLDPLPPIDHFAAQGEAPPGGAWPEAGDDRTSRVARAPDPAESGWGETDWQRYDWRSAAALGEAAVDEATTEWAATDWDGPGGPGHPPREPRQSAANAIATALDEIARRIREGDLSSSGPGPLTDPATIAATLAALLGVRR